MRPLCAALLLCVFAAPAAAATDARPALWHVRGPQGDVTLLGAIHLLPPDMNWQRPEIQSAIAKADVFVFETPTDATAQTRIQTLVSQHGQLPPGQSLRGLLPPASQADYDAALAASHLPAQLVDHERPWLVDLQLLVAQSAQEHFSQDNGVDHVVLAAAGERPKRYLETIDQQFALLAPDDHELELQEFEADLKDFRHWQEQLDPLVAAWSHGDVAAIDRLLNGDLAAFPKARATLLTDRNRKWVPQIETMLGEPHHFFVTVGAGHLTGPDGVPALLRQAGYKVDGP